MKLCSVTILYNPTDDFFDNLKTYSGFVDFIILVDNSSDIDEVKMKKKLETILGHADFIYLYEGINLGIAQALNKAIRWAKENAFTHVLTMDQDSGFSSSEFFKICLPFINDPRFGIVAASYDGKLPFRKSYNIDFDSVMFTITSGNIVSIKAWQNVGGFDDRFFIDEVDNDFCLRLIQEGFIIITSSKYFLKHSLGQTVSIESFTLKKSLSIGIHRPERIYFMVRNGLILIFSNLIKHPKFSLNRIWNLIVKFGVIIFFYPKKHNYLLYFFLGIKDFVFKRFNNSYLQN